MSLFQAFCTHPSITYFIFLKHHRRLLHEMRNFDEFDSIQLATEGLLMAASNLEIQVVRHVLNQESYSTFFE
jgi:hypothetical protein